MSEILYIMTFTEAKGVSLDHFFFFLAKALVTQELAYCFVWDTLFVIPGDMYKISYKCRKVFGGREEKKPALSPWKKTRIALSILQNQIKT